MAFDNSADSVENQGESFRDMSIADIDARLQERVPHTSLKFYDGLTHRGMFGLSKNMRVSLANEKRIITEATPVFMY